MSEWYPDDSELLAAVEDLQTGVPFIETGKAPYYLEFRRVLHRLIANISPLGLRVFKAGELAIRVKPGYCRLGGELRFFPGSTADIALPDERTSYVFLTADNTIGVADESAGWPTDEHVRLATVTTSDGGFEVSDIVDLRGGTMLGSLGSMLEATPREINQVADGVSENVTAGNLSELTDGGNADTLHLHGAAGLEDDLDLSEKTLTLPDGSVTASTLADTLDLSGKAITVAAPAESGHPARKADLDAAMRAEAQRLYGFSRHPVSILSTGHHGDDETWAQAATGSGTITVAADTANFHVGDRGVSLTWPNSGNRAALTTLPFAMPVGETVRLWLFGTTTNKFTLVRVRLYPQSADQNTYWEASLTVADGAQFIEVEKDDFGFTGTLGANTYWGTVQAVGIKAIATADGTPALTVGAIWSPVGAKAMVTLDFDGPKDTPYAGLIVPEMLPYGLKGCLQCVCGSIDGVNHMTTAQMNALYALGWPIMSHGYSGSSFDALATIAAIRGDIDKGIKFCAMKGWTNGRSGLSLLGNNYGTAVGAGTEAKAEVVSRFAYCRGTFSSDNPHNPPMPMDPFQIYMTGTSDREWDLSGTAAAHVFQLYELGADVSAVDVSGHTRYFRLIAKRAFTAAVSDTCTTVTDHLIATATAVRFSTTGTLPAPLLADTDYYVRSTGNKTFTLHPTANDATNNTNKIDITDTGTGTHYLPPPVPMVAAAQWSTYWMEGLKSRVDHAIARKAWLVLFTHQTPADGAHVAGQGNVKLSVMVSLMQYLRAQAASIDVVTYDEAMNLPAVEQTRTGEYCQRRIGSAGTQEIKSLT